MKKYKLVSLLLLLTLVFACGKKEAEKEFKKVTVKRGNILAEIPAVGVVTPRNRLEIKPPIAGRIEKILKEEGDSVKKGEIIALMSSSERAALLDSARTKGEKEFAYWEKVYQETPIIAPLNGFIIKRDIEAGQSVTASDAILVMADQLIIKGQIDETDIGQIKLGQRVSILLDAFQDQKIPGRVEAIAFESEVINNVTVYEVDILPLRIPSFFRSGMSATINFRLDEKKGVLTLPSQAVKEKDNNYYVFLFNKKEEIEKLQIQVGLDNGEKIEIVSGLKEEAEIIIPDLATVKKLLQNGSRRHGPFNPFTKENK